MDIELLQKYIAGNATEIEKQCIIEWIQESPENMREYMAQRRLYDMALWRIESTGEEKREKKRKHSANPVFHSLIVLLIFARIYL